MTTFGRSRSPSPPESTHRCRTTRSRSTPFATSVSPSQSWSRTIATSRRTPPSSSSWSTTPSSRSWIPSQPPRPRRACTIARSSTGDVDAAMAEADLVVRETFHVPRFTCLPVECYAVVADWDASAGRLTAWSNFQGPFTLHGVAAAALRLRGDRLRLITPPDSGGSFGIKSSVFGYVVLVGLASRKLGVPVRWIEDRLEHLAASAASTARVTEIEAGFTATGELIALRYDAIEDVGAYVRAPEPATLYRMHGSLSGAYRVRNVAARNRVVLTNTIPSGLNRGFGGPQLYFGLERTMAIGARRLGLDPVEVARRNLVRPRPCPTARPRAPSMTRATMRRASTRRSSSPATRRCGRGPRPHARRTARRRRHRLHRGALGLEHGLHHARPDGGRASGDAPEVRQRRGRRDRDRSARGHHRAARHHPAGSGTSHRLRAGGGRRARLRPAGRDGDVGDGYRHGPMDRGVRATTRRDSRAWASGRAGAALELRAKIDAIRDHPGDATSLSVASPGWPTGIPEALPEGMEPGLSAVAFWSAPNLDPPDADDRVASSAAHGIIVDVCALSRSTRRPARSQVLDYVTVHDAGVLLNPLLADGQVRGGFAHGVGAALFERHVYDESGNLMTASFVDYLAPTAPDLPAARIGHRSSPSPFTALGAKGIGEGNTMSAPVAIANAVADAIGRDDVELPLTAPRVWELLQPADAGSSRWRVKPVAFDTSRPDSLERGARRAGRGRRGREADRRRAEPRARAEHAARPARRCWSISTGRGSTRSTHENGTLRVGATVRQAALEREPARAHPLVRAGASVCRPFRDTQPRHDRRLDCPCRRRRRGPALPRRARRHGRRRGSGGGARSVRPTSSSPTI